MLSPLAEVAMHMPKPPQGACYAPGYCYVSALLCPAQGGAQVIVIVLQPLQPGYLVRPPQFGRRLLGQFQVEIGMALPDSRLFLALRQLLEPVLADCFQHTE